MNATGPRRPSDDEIASAMLRLRAADPVREAAQVDLDPDSMLASVRGDRGRHRPGRLRRAVPVLVAAAVVLIVAAAVAILPRIGGGSAGAGSRPAPGAAPAASAATAVSRSAAGSAPVVAENPIAAGARLPQLAQIAATETSPDGLRTELGLMPLTAARAVAKTLNTAPAIASTTPQFALACSMKPAYWRSVSLSISQMRSEGLTTVATLSMEDDCTGFVLQVGNHWYSSADTSLKKQLTEAYPRPAASLPQPTSIDVAETVTRYGAAPAASQGQATLTGAMAKRVWAELTALSDTPLPLLLCPAAPNSWAYTLIFRKDGHAYARAVVSTGCVDTAQLDIGGRAVPQLNYADALRVTVQASVTHASTSTAPRRGKGR